MFFHDMLFKRTSTCHLVHAQAAAILLIQMLSPDMALQIMLSANHILALVALEQLKAVTSGHVPPQLGRTSGHIAALAAQPLPLFVALALMPP
jgi:hypothetical protein